LVILLGGITPAVQVILPSPTHFSLAWSVSHIRAPCLNCSTDLDAIWQVHLWSPVTHCVTWGSLIFQGKGRFEGQTRSRNMQLQIAAKPSESYAATRQIQMRSWVDLRQ